MSLLRRLILRWQVYRTLRQFKRWIARVYDAPLPVALMMITRTRWEVCKIYTKVPEFQGAYLKALDTLEAGVRAKAENVTKPPVRPRHHHPAVPRRASAPPGKVGSRS